MILVLDFDFNDDMYNVTARCGRYVSPEMTCSSLDFSVAQWLVCGRSWVQFPSGTDKGFSEFLRSTHNHLLKCRPIYTSIKPYQHRL